MVMAVTPANISKAVKRLIAVNRTHLFKLFFIALFFQQISAVRIISFQNNGVLTF
ncbi:hypothetical protein [Pantoea allii]|uniref:hypothetical protein n=1 Tax=Pantoea allii TaxID=574096 RepID=UPI001301D734|nr:hypothetical protein [Pantoea allii]MBW1253197.1 hypothetical protein [Pantoea allii]MBW1262707.1 hypothetical protein [Pantoea allii]MBW1284545.1 hypothetical protein [Pantoea allii]